MHLHLRNQRLIKRVVSARILHPHFQDIVDIASQPVRLLHLGSLSQRPEKPRLPVRLMLTCADQHKETRLKSQRLRVQQYRLLTDHPSLAHLANPIPHRRLR